MKIGIISDTHGDHQGTIAAVELFRERKVQRIIHCGDIGTAETVLLFDRGIATDFVFGNCDMNTKSLKEAILERGFTCHERFGALELEGKSIAFLHGDDHQRFERELSGGAWDLLCYGHTHIADLRLHAHTLVLNPGAIYRSAQPSIALVELPEMNVQSCYINKVF